MQEWVLTVAIGCAGLEQMVQTEANRSSEAKNQIIGVCGSDEHAGRNEDENDQTVAPEQLHQANREIRGASKDRAMHVGPNWASCTKKDKNPPQQAGCTLANIEPGGERVVKLSIKRRHFMQHAISEFQVFSC